MDISVQYDNQVCIVELSGRFDAQYADDIETALGDPIRLTPQLVINMAEVFFVDSRALAVLIRAMKACRAGGGDVHLVALQPSVYTIFELTRLDRAFQIFATRAAALHAFGAN
ncbi:MAG: STAS domain-containing protein [Anaerolineales bacterium]